jgi:hypothetical protein
MIRRALRTMHRNENGPTQRTSVPGHHDRPDYIRRSRSNKRPAPVAPTRVVRLLYTNATSKEIIATTSMPAIDSDDNHHPTRVTRVHSGKK